MEPPAPHPEVASDSSLFSSRFGIAAGTRRGLKIHDQLAPDPTTAFGICPPRFIRERGYYSSENLAGIRSSGFAATALQSVVDSTRTSRPNPFVCTNEVPPPE